MIECNGGNRLSLGSSLERAINDGRTLTALANAGVKIYDVQSAAAVIALSVRRFRDMAADAAIGLRSPLLPSDLFDVDKENRLVGFRFEECRKPMEVL